MQSILGRRIAWQVVSYSREWDFEDANRGGHWTVKRVERTSETRTGIVWSAGPVDGTAWVIPDQRESGEGYAVCVRIGKDGRHVQRPTDTERSNATGHLCTLANRRNLRRGIRDLRGARRVTVKTP
jgi:hypothetical protein